MDKCCGAKKNIMRAILLSVKHSEFVLSIRKFRVAPLPPSAPQLQRVRLQPCQVE